MNKDGKWELLDPSQFGKIDQILPEYELMSALHNIKNAGESVKEIKIALANMWYAYVNKDENTPHQYELEAVKMAEKILGKWEDCMPDLLSMKE